MVTGEFSVPPNLADDFDDDNDEGTITATAVNVHQPVVQRRPDLPCVSVIHRLMGTHGEQTLIVRYPLTFHLGCVFTLLSASSWLLYFSSNVFPEAIQASEGPCRFSDDQLRQNSVVLFAYFLCFAIVRICIFFPGVAARVAEIMMGYQGIWRTYALHMILHGPLYIFGIGSMLFAFQLLMSPPCDEDPVTPGLHRKLRLYAVLSIAVFLMCMVLAFFHSRIIAHAAATQEEERRKAPKGTLDKLLTYIYKDHKELFGDEDGQMYFAECPICLSEWEDNDIIKITPCGHSFHKECIAGWIRSERTCAFCRQDVVHCPGRSFSRPTPPASPTRIRSLLVTPESPMARYSLDSPLETVGPEHAMRIPSEATPALPDAQVIGVSEVRGGEAHNSSDEEEEEDNTVRVLVFTGAQEANI